jgi:hypothetical protein
MMMNVLQGSAIATVAILSCWFAPIEDVFVGAPFVLWKGKERKFFGQKT